MKNRNPLVSHNGGIVKGRISRLRDGDTIEMWLLVEIELLHVNFEVLEAIRLNDISFPVYRFDTPEVVGIEKAYGIEVKQFVAEWFMHKAKEWHKIFPYDNYPFFVELLPGRSADRLLGGVIARQDNEELVEVLNQKGYNKLLDNYKWK